MHKIIRRGLMGAVMVIGLAGCAGTGINKGDFNIISVEEEWQLGQQLEADIAAQMPVLDSGPIYDYVNRMGRTILAQATGDSEVADLPWEFHVIKDESVNAFNIPGGHVYIHSGLVAKADSYHELMAVMGHEVSHGLARHAVENLSKQYGIVALASLVLGENPAVYEEILASVLAGGAVMKFSRDAEREADRLGLNYVYMAGINPNGMITFFQKLIELRGRQPSSLEQFFSSHPLSEERIANAEEQIASFPAKTLTSTDAGFADFKQRVAAASQ